MLSPLNTVFIFEIKTHLETKNALNKNVYFCRWHRKEMNRVFLILQDKMAVELKSTVIYVITIYNH